MEHPTQLVLPQDAFYEPLWHVSHFTAAQVIFCAAARTTVTADLLRVDNRGVVNIAKAMQVSSNA
jgi:hypothetical protein